MKIVLIGADGQLGTDLYRSLKDHHRVHPCFYPDVDITRPADLKVMLDAQQPAMVINTAAYNLVDNSEHEPLAAFRLNALAVRSLAVICRDIGASLMHFSSDYVFDGRSRTPYTEEDVPHPLGVYGVSKLAGEYFVSGALDRHYLIRTSGLYGEAGCWGKGTNFVDSMVRMAREGRPIRVVDDQWITPTSTRELAMRIRELIISDSFGLYHLTNEGQCTWFAFAQEIFHRLGIDPRLNAVGSDSYASAARRPAYSVLDKTKAYRLGISRFSPWQDALDVYLHKKGYKK
jgi:dTDP-4-dehydrorhamnose reductase